MLGFAPGPLCTTWTPHAAAKRATHERVVGRWTRPRSATTSTTAPPHSRGAPWCACPPSWSRRPQPGTGPRSSRSYARGVRRGAGPSASTPRKALWLAGFVLASLVGRTHATCNDLDVNGATDMMGNDCSYYKPAHSDSGPASYGFIQLQLARRGCGRDASRQRRRKNPLVISVRGVADIQGTIDVSGGKGGTTPQATTCRRLHTDHPCNRAYGLPTVFDIGRGSYRG